ncbi:hypothetical protein BC834DRAFT_974974 [Gloeopeniophorella convolvens]|nr:hypothetical protein BC834DRAFT_974974 [Gloeopeniophorella convolvens]
MLVNLLRLLDAVKTKKASRQIVTCLTQVVLPLSPNHGLFGNDGLYSEVKISFETLFNRWSSESWSEYACLVGAIIGWTRGTGLMDQSNMVAQEVELHGVRTCFAKEMAFNILGLMHPILFSITQAESVWGDLRGGFDCIADLGEMTTCIRVGINNKVDLRHAIARDNAAEFKILNGAESSHLPDVSGFEQLSRLRNVIDLDNIIIISGFGEVWPWGLSCTCWEMETKGRLALEGCIEMAWMVGYIKHFDDRLKDSSLIGWVDVKTGEPVDDKDIRGKYKKDISNHAGVCFFKPELLCGYDPRHKTLNLEVELIHDIESLEASDTDAEEFKKEHGEKCDIWASEGGRWFVKLRRGARIYIPKAISYNCLIAGQLPNGWNAACSGIPNGIIAHTDHVSLCSLYMRPSEVGMCLGSSMGGMHSLSQMFKERRDEKEVQSDIMQETATALRSMEIAPDIILSGKAKIMIVGDVNNVCEEGSYEFGNMKAMSNSKTEFAMGREPTEMSRPIMTTRAGFMESQGVGVHIVMTVKTALELGCLIRGIVAFSSTLIDKAGCSISSPGRGALSVAREVQSKHVSLTLSTGYHAC